MCSIIFQQKHIEHIQKLVHQEITVWQQTCNDVLASLLNGTLDHRVRLGQPLQPLHQLGQIRSHLGLHCHTHLHKYNVLYVNCVGHVQTVVITQRSITYAIQNQLTTIKSIHFITRPCRAQPNIITPNRPCWSDQSYRHGRKAQKNVLQHATALKGSICMPV